MKPTVVIASLGCVLAYVASAQDVADQGVRFEFGTTLNVVLSDTVDARKSKPGDTVKARTSEDVKAGGEIVIPRGTRLLGHVTEAHTAGQGDARAVLGMTFDRAELKNGQAIPLHAAVYALAAPEGESNASASGGGFGGGFGGGSSGLGNIVSAAGHAASDDASALGAGSGMKHEELKPSAGAIGGLNSSGNLYASSRGVFGIEDVTVQQNTLAGGGDPVIVSTGRSVHLSSGTRILLSVASAADGGKSNKS